MDKKWRDQGMTGSHEQELEPISLFTASHFDVLQEKLVPFVVKLNTYLVQQWGKMQEDPGQGGVNPVTFWKGK